MTDANGMSPALPEPQPNGDSLPYWNAARERRLLIRKCNACDTHHFMPRQLCPDCWSDQLEWVESRGRGTVHSFSIVHRAPTSTFAANTPYVIALIDLEEGPRMFANLVGEKAFDAAIGDPVQVTFEERGYGTLVPQFRRAEE